MKEDVVIRFRSSSSSSSKKSIQVNSFRSHLLDG
jgi:hypothetical protein